MEHIHATKEELFDWVIHSEEGAPEKEQYLKRLQEFRNCSVCSKQLDEIYQLQSEIGKIYFHTPAGSPVARMVESINSPDDFKKIFLENSPSVNAPEGKPENNSRLFIRPLAAAVLLAVFLTGLNYGRFLFGSKKGGAVSSEPLIVTQSGLFWGALSFTTKEIPEGKTTVTQAEKNGVITIQGAVETKISLSNLAKLGIDTDNNNSLTLFSGAAIIMFHSDQKDVARPLIYLADGSYFESFGTSYFIQYYGDSAVFTLLDGKGVIHFGDQSKELPLHIPMVLDRVEGVLRDPSERVDRFSIMAYRKQIEKYQNTLNQQNNDQKPSSAPDKKALKSVPEPSKIISLEEIESKYGPITVIIDRDGERYIGAFNQDGNTIVVYTEYGPVELEAENVESFLPYRR